MAAPKLPYLAVDDPQLAPSDNLPDARAAVERARIDPGAEPHQRTVLDFVDTHDDALRRSCPTGHLTASALVVDPTGSAVVMLHHRKLRRWLQPGGHCDGDANLAAVALREAHEETGIEGLMVHPVAVDVDVHEVDPPGEGRHLHLDVRFLVASPDDTEPTGNPESTDIRWVTESELDDLGVDEGTRRLVRQGLTVHRELSSAR